MMIEKSSTVNRMLMWDPFYCHSPLNRSCNDYRSVIRVKVFNACVLVQQLLLVKREENGKKKENVLKK
jgi:hypothetical protein